MERSLVGLRALVHMIAARLNAADEDEYDGLGWTEHWLTIARAAEALAREARRRARRVDRRVGAP
jgi:hypothetical protein